MENKYEILINKENPIDEKIYKTFELIEILNVDDEKIKIEKLTYDNYLKLNKELLEKENIEVGISNSFRDLEKQEEICKEYVKLYCEELAYKLAAIPGTSEHHTGLAIDITVKKDDGIYAETNEELYEAESKFLIVHKYLYKYGFILRYPKNKTDITKYNYEPWHIRYVGEKIAKICFFENITLEEYYNCKIKNY